MRTVNPNFLETPLDPLIGGADIDELCAAYSALDPNDETAVRAMIRELLVPYVLSLNKAIHERIRLAYQYYLSKPDSNFRDLFLPLMLPFGIPHDPRRFIQWVWEECFPGEDYRLSNLDDIVINDDIDEWQRLWTR
jgi:hypothetical protein